MKSLAIAAAVLTLTAGPALGARGGNGHGHGNVGTILATHGHGQGHGNGDAAGHGQGRGHRGAAPGAAGAASYSAARRQARDTSQVAAALGHGHGHGHAYGHLKGRVHTRGAARAGVLARAGAAHGARHGRGHAYGHLRGKGNQRRAAALAAVNRAASTVARATRSAVGTPSAATHPAARTAGRSAARDRRAAATGPAARALAALPRRRTAAHAAGAAGTVAATTADANDGTLSHLVAPVAIPTAATVARENAAATRPASTAHATGFAAASGSAFIQIIEHIPLWLWVALVGALLFALLTGISALLAGRRARRQEGMFAALSAAALTDPLTGVLNRRGFGEAVERELARARRYGHPFVLAYVDVRGLKGVNDTEGHQVGDKLLQEAAAMLGDSARADDVVGRLGGDEMALLLVEQTPEGAAAVTERLQSEVAARRAALALRAPWALTVGTAAFPEDGEDFDQLLRTADHRLYEQRGIELRNARVAPSRAPALP